LISPPAQIVSSIRMLNAFQRFNLCLPVNSTPAPLSLDIHNIFLYGCWRFWVSLRLRFCSPFSLSLVFLFRLQHVLQLLPGRGRFFNVSLLCPARAWRFTTSRFSSTPSGPPTFFSITTCAVSSFLQTSGKPPFPPNNTPALPSPHSGTYPPTFLRDPKVNAPFEGFGPS